jgi:hypothetical protein
MATLAEARAQWRKIPRSQRRQVRRYVEEGGSPPNPDALRTAEVWAMRVSELSWWNRYRGPVLESAVIVILFLVLIGLHYRSAYQWIGVALIYPLTDAVVRWTEREMAEKLTRKSNSF